MNQIRPKQNKYWLTFGLCALTAAIMFLPFLIVDKGLFLYAGDFNSQQIPFYYYSNQFIKHGGSYSWATDLGSGFVNSYSFYLLGSPFWLLSLLLPAKMVPFFMVPLLILKFALAGAGAQLWLKRWVKNTDLAVLGGCLYAFSGFTVYNVFFNHFVDVVALFPYLLWALDAAVFEKRRGWFAVLVALNLLDNYFFFAGQIVFLVIYFICMAVSGVYKINRKCFGRLAAESLLGCGIGCVLALPAVFFLMENPRTVNPFSGYGYLLYGQSQQYGAILYNLFFPPDSPYMPVVFDKGVIKWTSMSAYLPMVGFAGVWAYLRCKQRDSFKRILCVCFIMALVPVLNSSFYALNSSYYARWYYMPVLIMCAATVKALEDEDVQLEKGLKPTLCVLLAFCAFAFVPVKPKEEGESWTIGVLDEPAKFWLSFGLAALGVLVFWLLWLLYRKHPKFSNRVCACTLVFAVVMGISHISIGKFAQWENDKNWRQQQYVDARTLAETMPEGAYRIDAYKCYDNVCLWMDKSSVNCFQSTVSPSIMEFYPQFGEKRDVRSKPSYEKYALRSLLGVKYTIVPENKRSEFEKEAGGSWSYWDTEGQLAVYENEYVLPFVYAYESYVTDEEFENIAKEQRDKLLMRALVLSDEQIEQYGHMLTRLSDMQREGFTLECFEADRNRRLSMAARDVKLDDWGLTAQIELQKENLVFLAVPFDKGFTAQVDGEQTELLKVSGGLCAVPVPAGGHEIRLTYHTPGLKAAVLISLFSLLLLCLWIFAGRRSRRPEEEPQDDLKMADLERAILNFKEEPEQTDKNKQDKTVQQNVQSAIESEEQ